MPQVTVTIRGRDKVQRKSVSCRSSLVEEIIRKAGVNPLEVLVRLNGEFVPDIARARSGDKIELLQITSRG